MQTFFDYLNANPWIYAIVAVSTAIWVWAVWVIFASVGAGMAMVIALILRQIADPRFAGTYLRQS